MSGIQNDRLAALVMLAEKSPRLGRTAFMKLCYFLQTLRGVPLGYRFRLYSYGPFDSSVLSDLATVEDLGGLHSDVVFYPSGYGYEFMASEKSAAIQAPSAAFLNHWEADIDWVIQQFAKLGSADLELLSTIIYVDREFKGARQKLTLDGIVQRVHEVKPHFSESSIREKADDLYRQGLLQSV